MTDGYCVCNEKAETRIDFKLDFEGFIGFILDRFTDIGYHKFVICQFLSFTRGLLMAMSRVEKGILPLLFQFCSGAI